MSKRLGPTRIKLSDYKESKANEGRIEIEADDGTVFVIPPAVLWPDDAADRYRLGDIVGCARVIMGEEEYEAFKAAGGSAGIVGALVGEEYGANPGE